MPSQPGIASRPGLGAKPGLRPGQGGRPAPGQRPANLTASRPGNRSIQPGRWPGDWHGWNRNDWNHGHWGRHHYYPWAWAGWGALGAWVGSGDWDTPIIYDYGVDNGYVYNGD